MQKLQQGTNDLDMEESTARARESGSYSFSPTLLARSLQIVMTQCLQCTRQGSPLTRVLLQQVSCDRHLANKNVNDPRILLLYLPIRNHRIHPTNSCNFIPSQTLYSISTLITMETIKSVLGLGTTAPQEGREPVSGVTGSGVAGEPYDQGNAEGM
jgi:hypothetical protein